MEKQEKLLRFCRLEIFPAENRVEIEADLREERDRVRIFASYMVEEGKVVFTEFSCDKPWVSEVLAIWQEGGEGSLEIKLGEALSELLARFF